MGCSSGAKDSIKEFGNEQKEMAAKKKQDVLNTFKARLENSNITGINLIMITTYTLKRSSHDKVREKKKRYLWFLKDSNEYDFSKEPYRTLKNQFRSQLKTNYSTFYVYPEKILPLHLYEEIEVNFKFFSLNDEESLEYTPTESGVNCLILYNLIDLESIPIIKEIHDYSRKIPEEVFKPVFIVKTVVKDVEGYTKLKDTLLLLGLGKIDFKFLRKNQSYFERKVLDTTKQSTILLYDARGRLRFYENIFKFSMNEIEFILHSQYYPLEQNSFKKLRSNVFDSFNSLMLKESFIKSSIDIKISMRKAKIYNTDKTLYKWFFELPRIYIFYKDCDASLNQECLDFMRNQCGLISSLSTRKLKKNEVSELLKMPYSLVLNQFKVDNLQSTLEIYENRRFYRYLDMNKEKIKNFNCYVSINHEMHNEVINLISDIMKVIRKVKIQVPIEYHGVPQLGTKYRSSIKLFSTNTDKNCIKSCNIGLADVVNLSNLDKIKIIVLFSINLSSIFKWRCLLEKLQMLNDTQSGLIELIFIYQGDDLNSVEELVTNTFLSNKNQSKIKILHSKGDSVNHIFLNSEYYQYFIVILNKQNFCEYVGNANEFDLVTSVEEMIKTDKFEKKFPCEMSLSEDKFIQLKQSFLNVKDLIKKNIKSGKCLYQPFLELLSTKVDNFKNCSIVNSIYKDITIKIKLKKVNLDDPTNVIENFLILYKSLFYVPLDIDYYNVVTIKVSKKCSDCEVLLPKIQYYCPNSDQHFCLDCEKNRNMVNYEDFGSSKLHPNCLILIRCEKTKILEEIIEKYYNLNNESSKPLEIDTKFGLFNLECLICVKNLMKNCVLFMSLLQICNEKLYEVKSDLGIIDNINPIIFCEDCIKIILDRDMKKLQYLLKKNESNILSSDFDFHNFVLKKIILS